MVINFGKNYKKFLIKAGWIVVLYHRLERVMMPGKERQYNGLKIQAFNLTRCLWKTTQIINYHQPDGKVVYEKQGLLFKLSYKHSGNICKWIQFYLHNKRRELDGTKEKNVMSWSSFGWSFVVQKFFLKCVSDLSKGGCCDNDHMTHGWLGYKIWGLHHTHNMPQEVLFIYWALAGLQKCFVSVNMWQLQLMVRT